MPDLNNEPLTFMAVHAHPDDEIFANGVTFARLAAEGIRTILITATRGEMGEIVDPALDETAKEAIFAKLGEVREGELEASARALNVHELCFLGYRDSGMAGTADNQNPASFYQANIDEAVRRLVKFIRQFRPQVISTYEPWGGYGHPDHVQAHRVTSLAFDAAGDGRFYPELNLPPWNPLKLYYSAIPRAMFQKAAEEMRAKGIDGPWNNPEMDTGSWGTPEDQITTRFEGQAYLENKINAFRAHKTQIAPNNFIFLIPEEFQKEILGFDFYTLARTRLAESPLPETGFEEDLFKGLR